MSILLDANASLGLLAAVRERIAALPASLLNPNSVHHGGQSARLAVETARASLGSMLGLRGGDRVVFTSGATESNNCALLQPVLSALAWGELTRFGSLPGPVIITTALEHPSVLEAARRAAAMGATLAVVEPNESGTISPADIASFIGPATRLVSVMLANNETGLLLPVREIAAEVKRIAPKVLVHTDAVQAPGRVPVSFQDLGVDLMSISGHKLGAMTGVGALIVREGANFEPLLVGGPQETHRRAGTENVHGIASLGFAADLILEQRGSRGERMCVETEALWSGIRSALPDAALIHAQQPRLPNTLSVHIPGVRADDLVVALDRRGILVSSGAACASGKPEPSHVLLAVGLSPDQARETVRISTAGDLDPAAIPGIVASIADAAESVRGANTQSRAVNQ